MTTHRDHRVYAPILAGGAATRFWPAPPGGSPKQLLPLLGSEPLIRDTVLRVLPLCAGPGAGEPAASGWERVLVASGRHLIEPTAAILPELPSPNLLAEPMPRNTAPCIGWAAA